MSRIRLLFLASAIVFAGCGEAFAPVIVVAGSGTSLARCREIITAAGGDVKRDLAIVNAVAARIPEEARSLIVQNPGIARIDDDAEVRLVDAEGDAAAKGGGSSSSQPVQSTPWGITKVGAPSAWATATGSGIVVAVIDTGGDKTHPDLAANILGGANFTSAKGGDPNGWGDDNGHGTHVSGTIAALDNAIGVVGVAPGAKLLEVKVLDRRGSGYVSDIIAGIEWAVSNGADIAGMSLGTSADVQALHDACDAADAAGVLLVAAAGNSGDGNPATDNVGYPAKYASVVSVAATNSSDVVASFSSDGPDNEVCAPGVSVLSAWKGGTYATKNGTSMAQPHASGVAALLMSANGAWSKDCLRAALSSSAADLGAPGRDVFYGNGLVNAPAALATASTACTPAP